MEPMISWYQRKIGAYDLQIWERAIEIQEQQDGRMDSMNKRSSSVRRDLIDVDLVRGSTFSKNKPHYSWLTVTCQGIIRILLLPLFYKWWMQQSSRSVTIVFCLMYCLQCCITWLYLTGNQEQLRYIPLSEVTMPFVFMLVLGSIHCHVVSTNFRPYPRSDCRKNHQKRTLSSALLEPLTSSSQQTALSFVSSSVGKTNSKKAGNGRPDGHSSDESPVAHNFMHPESHVIIGRKKRKSVSEEPDCDHVQPEANEFENSPTLETFITGPDTEAESQNNSLKCDGDSDRALEMTRDSRRVQPPLFWEESSGSDTSSLTDNCGSDTENDGSSDAAKGAARGEVGQNSRLSVTALLPYASSGHDRVGVKIWESNQCKKIQVSLLDIGGIIRKKVQDSSLPTESFALGFCFSCLIAHLPTLFRVIVHSVTQNYDRGLSKTIASFYSTFIHDAVAFVEEVFLSAHGQDWSVRTVFIIHAVSLERFICSFVLFLMLVTALRTFRQRLLFAKYFSHLTSARRARKSDIPHFRLDKVENVRFWLSLRSYLRRRGPQRSVDVIVSSAFFISLCLLCFISVQLLHDTNLFLSSLVHWEMTAWLLAVAVFLLNFLTLGAQINRKYSNVSILLTEQINLYLQMNEKPHKKEELQRVNGVLSLATKLIKEIETPFNIYGLAMNPLLYNITRVVVLSAFSGVISEILGFKLKIWKIKSK